MLKTLLKKKQFGNFSESQNDQKTVWMTQYFPNKYLIKKKAHKIKLVKTNISLKNP